MNIFNRFFLRIVLAPSGIYRKMGVDLPHLKAILVAKLMMDDRRVSGLQQAKKKKQPKPPKNATIATMFMTAVLGCVFLMAFAVGSDYITKLTVYFGFYIFTLTSVLISDFTSVLIDVRDNMIILPKPVNDRTFVLARLLHIVIHISKMVIPLALPGIIAIGIKQGVWGALSMVFIVLAATLFTIFLINALYLFILKITTPEKFKTIISYFQIFFAITIYASYQIVPRMFSKAVLAGISISSVKYIWLFIPYWFAGGWQYLQDLQLNSPLFIYLLLTLLLPILSIWIVIKYFAPSFNRKLSMISGSDGESRPVDANSKKIVSTTSGYVRTLANLFTQQGPERMSFLNTWKITGRSREFKLKVYPSIGYLAVYVVILFMNMRQGSSSEAEMASRVATVLNFAFIVLLYLSSFALMVAIGQIPYSEKYKAAWMYYITPIQTPGNLLSGALKSAIAKFYFPVAGLSCIAAIIFVGPAIIPNLLLALFNQVLVFAFIGYLTMRELPFSTQQSLTGKGGNFVRGVISMLFPAMLALIHFLCYKFSIVIIILCVLSGIASWLMMDALKNKSWEKVQLREYEN